MAVAATNLEFDYSKYGFHEEENYVFKSGKGLNEAVVRELSGMEGRAGVDVTPPLAGGSKSFSRRKPRSRVPGPMRNWLN